MMLTVSFVQQGTFTWQALDNNNGVISSGTGTSVQNAGAQALTAMKTYLSGQVTSFTSLGTGWQ